MEVKNRKIIITDPCYIFGKLTDDWMELMEDFEQGTDRVENEFGITDYIWRPTIVGDWWCSVIKTPYNPKYEFEKIVDDGNLNNITVSELLGEFTADAGLAGVFYLDEVLKLVPDILDTLPSCCRTIIQYEGEISCHIYCNCLSIIGKGTNNFNFLTYHGGY